MKQYTSLYPPLENSITRITIDLEPELNKEPGYGKPHMSYAQLIAEALNNAPEQTLVLSDIYKAINAKHPYYDLETKGWQNSIRHNLTLNKNFIKEERFGQVGYWKLSKDVPKSLLETKQKYFEFSGKSKNKRRKDEYEKKCEFCKLDFETRLSLIQHIQKLHAGESEASNLEKRYTCNICNEFKAYYMSEIRKHKKRCENLLNVLKVEKQDNGQFKCPFCPYVMEKSGQIKRHIKDMHPDKVEKQDNGQFKCPFCPCVQEKSGQIKTHIKNMHPDKCDVNQENGNYEDSNVKEENKFFVTNESGIEFFSCSRCGMKFSGFNGEHIKKCWNNAP